METKEKKSFIIDVPMGGHREKLDIAPFAGIFDQLDRDELLKSLRSLMSDSYATYARTLEHALENESDLCIIPNHLDNLYHLGLIIEHIEKCNFVEKKNVA